MIELVFASSHAACCRPAGALTISDVNRIVDRAFLNRIRLDGDSGVTTGHVSVSIKGADEVQLWDELVQKRALG